MLLDLLVLLLIVLAFIAGLMVAGNYYRQIISHYQYAEKILAADRGLGYIAPPQTKNAVTIGQPFMDRLKENGRATQALRIHRR